MPTLEILGKLVNELIYEHIDADVAEWLKTNAPKPRQGQNYHQWSARSNGLKELLEWVVIGIAKTCTGMSELIETMAQMYRKYPQYTLYLTAQKA